MTVPPGAPVARAGHARMDHDRPAELLGAGREVERVQSLHVGGRAAAHLLGRRDDVERVRSLGSITGVPVIPISFGMSPRLARIGRPGPA